MINCKKLQKIIITSIGVMGGILFFSCTLEKKKMGTIDDMYEKYGGVQSYWKGRKYTTYINQNGNKAPLSNFTIKKRNSSYRAWFPLYLRDDGVETSGFELIIFDNQLKMQVPYIFSNSTGGVYLGFMNYVSKDNQGHLIIMNRAENWIEGYFYGVLVDMASVIDTSTISGKFKLYVVE